MEEISFKALYKMIDNEINSACKDKQKLINYLKEVKVDKTNTQAHQQIYHQQI